MKKICFFVSLVLFFSCGKTSEEQRLNVVIDSLKNEIRDLKAANDTLSEHLMERAYLTRDYPDYFDSIEQPEEHLLEHLRQSPSVIPKEAVLGGTMRFTNVEFINDELVVAEYEDGHVLGKAVYAYTMDKRGNLQFRLVGTIR